MLKTNDLLKIVRRADFEEIEESRDLVEFHHFGELAAAYSSLESWNQKAALINLVQDHLDPRFRPIMLDFLRAPDTRGDDVIPLTKAIALCHLDENFDDFMRYYNNTQLIDERASEYLKNRGETYPKKQAEKPNSNKSQSYLQIFAVIISIIGFAGLAISAINQNTLNQYRENGITAKARVTDKWIDNGDNCVGVSYFDKDLLDRGELYLTEVCEFIPNETWDLLRVDSNVNVVFLPDDPTNFTILAATLENQRLSSSYQYLIWGNLLGLGILFLALQFIWNKLRANHSL